MKKIILRGCICLSVFLLLLVLSLVLLKGGGFFESFTSDPNKSLVYRFRTAKLEQFRFDEQERNDTDGVILISFNLKDPTEYDMEYNSKNEGVNDIGIIKSIAENYLAEYDSYYNDQKIQILFYTLPGDAMVMYNYDYRDNGNDIRVGSFEYFQWLEVCDFSELECLGNVRVLDTSFIRNIDSFDFLNEWNDAEYIHINDYSINEPEDKKHLTEKIKAMLPETCIIEI